MRSIAASTRLRTPSSKVRTLSLMMASSGMTFSLVPACSAPTVTTAASAAATSRETMVCSRITVAAAMTTGSMLACGIDPCAPRPNRRICKLSAADVMAPARPATVPDGPTMTCWPEHHVRLGKALEQARRRSWPARLRRSLRRAGRPPSGCRARSIACLAPATWSRPRARSRACRGRTCARPAPSCLRDRSPSPCSHTAGRSPLRPAAHPCRRAA